MMRKPNIRSAVVDLVFAAAALIAGIAGLPVSTLVLVFATAVAVWAWTRRASLGAMNMRMRLVNSALALIMFGVVLGLAYFIGLVLGGHN